MKLYWNVSLKKKNMQLFKKLILQTNVFLIGKLKKLIKRKIYE